MGRKLPQPSPNSFKEGVTGKKKSRVVKPPPSPPPPPPKK